MNPPSNENQPTPDFGAPLIERIYRAFFGKPFKPDPWTPEDAAAANDPTAHKLCLRCLQPQPRTPQSWFCPNCGEPDCDNVNKHYLNIFSQGTLFRRLIMGQPEKGFRGFFEKLFFVLYTMLLFPLLAWLFFFIELSWIWIIWLLIQFTLPILYWYWMVCKAVGQPIRDDIVPPPDLSDAESREPPPPPPPPSPRQRAAALTLKRLPVFFVTLIVALSITFVIVAASAPTSSSAQSREQNLRSNNADTRFRESQPVLYKH